MTESRYVSAWELFVFTCCSIFIRVVLDVTIILTIKHTASRHASMQLRTNRWRYFNMQSSRMRYATANETRDVSVSEFVHITSLV